MKVMASGEGLRTTDYRVKAHSTEEAIKVSIDAM